VVESLFSQVKTGNFRNAPGRVAASGRRRTSVFAAPNVPSIEDSDVLEIFNSIQSKRLSRLGVEVTSNE